jgi:peroxiredoxin
LISVFTLSALFLLACSSENTETEAASKSEAKTVSEKKESSSKTAEVGSKAPDFTLTSVEGNQHNLSDFGGKYVILEWINFDCPFVQKHYHSGNMQELQNKYRDKGAVWLTICSSAPGKQGYFEGDKLKDRIESEKWAADAYLIDSEGTVGRMYAARTTPHMYIISPEGILAYAGAIDDKPSTKPDDIPNSTNYVVEAMTSLLAGEEVETSSTTAYGCSVKY